MSSTTRSLRCWLAEEVNSEQIETILAKFSEMGINVVETKDARPEEDKPPMTMMRRTTRRARTR